MNKLFENIKELQEGHANSYPENALRLLMVQSTTQHLGLRKLGARMKMGFGKEMNGFSKRLFRLHKADIYKHLEDILTKVDDQERNGKGVWTKNQAKRLKAKIKEVQDAYVEKEKNKIQGYVFGNTNRRAA
ncbi:MAG: hypothetical protein LBG59_03465 [Candidatus Peribacteria bacterium]|jgi:hypothetical protein|nr:hypothetical protein [Candidatus Peribacteria bacterium]